jgi:hypothetical protein
MRRLFTPEEPDVRPTLLGIVTLMFLLLFFLLSTSSGQRLGIVDLRLAAPGEAPPLPHAGLVQAVRVVQVEPGWRVEFDVSSTDIAAVATTRELRTLDAPDLPGLAGAPAQVHDVDPSQERATLVPAPDTRAEGIFAALDVVRAAGFPKVGLR